MPAPAKIALPKRKRNAKHGFCWGNFMLGAALGTLCTWLIMSDTVDFQQLFQDEQPTPVADQTSPAEQNDRNQILDNLPIEFYKLLPNREEQVSDQAISQQLRDKSAAKPDATHYRLLAGSFQNQAGADSRRAGILILGLEAQIEKVTQGGKIWYRVMLGPFTTLQQLDTAKRRLQENGIKPRILKPKNTGH